MTGSRRCWWARLGARLPRLPRHRVGVSGRRRRAAVREAEPRGVPGRAVVADDPAQARGVPAGVRGLRRRAGRPLRRARRQPAARGRLDRPPPRQDRGGDQQRRGGCSSCRTSTARWRRTCGGSSRRDAPTSWSGHARRLPTTPRVPRAREGPEAARLAVRRPDDRVRVHAGDGAGQRPRRRMRRRRRGRGGRGPSFSRPAEGRARARP